MRIAMKTIRLFLLLFLTALAAQAAEPASKQFLRYIYGADGIEVTNFCHPSDDLWMLRGSKNTNALSALDTLKIESKPTGVTSGLVHTDLYFIEIRDGKVDPSFNLEGIYAMHRQLVQHFIYAALSQNQRMLGALVTDAKKVKMDGPKAAKGDMNQYASIIELLPVVRSSKPAEDRKTVDHHIAAGMLSKAPGCASFSAT